MSFFLTRGFYVFYEYPMNKKKTHVNTKMKIQKEGGKTGGRLLQKKKVQATLTIHWFFSDSTRFRFDNSSLIT